MFVAFQRIVQVSFTLWNVFILKSLNRWNLAGEYFTNVQVEGRALSLHHTGGCCLELISSRRLGVLKDLGDWALMLRGEGTELTKQVLVTVVAFLGLSSEFFQLKLGHGF